MVVSLENCLPMPAVKKVSCNSHYFLLFIVSTNYCWLQTRIIIEFRLSIVVMANFNFRLVKKDLTRDVLNCRRELQLMIKVSLSLLTVEITEFKSDIFLYKSYFADLIMEFLCLGFLPWRSVFNIVWHMGCCKRRTSRTWRIGHHRRRKNYCGRSRESQGTNFLNTFLNSESTSHKDCEIIYINYCSAYKSFEFQLTSLQW